MSDRADDTDRAAQLRARVESSPTISIDEFRRRSRRSFLTGAAGIVVAGLGWRWVQTQSTDDGIPNVLRNTLEVNETLWKNLSNGRSAPEYAVSAATPIQVNGRIGIREEVDLTDYRVRVEGRDGQLLDELDVAAFDDLPQHDMVTEHKCIEGWSNITHWGGSRFSDLHARYADDVGDAPWVGLETPDGDYYVGLDLEVMLHPQSLMVRRIDDQPLDQAHGAPLRFATPNKYGIKCLKRVGVIRYSNERPRDYWAERSYDYYAGL